MFAKYLKYFEKKNNYVRRLNVLSKEILGNTNECT